MVQDADTSKEEEPDTTVVPPGRFLLDLPTKIENPRPLGPTAG